MELVNLLAERRADVAELNHAIEQLTQLTSQQRKFLSNGIRLDLEADEKLMERLRGLGYVE